MQPTDTSFAAGAFDEDAFRSSIRSTMQMGMPSDPARQLTWHWDRDQTFDIPDTEGNPYDWTATPDTDVPGNVVEPTGSLVVVYAMEFSARPAASKDTEMGEFDGTRIIVTLLDTEFEQVKTADYCVFDGDRYRIDFTAPPVALFTVTVYSVFLTAEDES